MPEIKSHGVERGTKEICGLTVIPANSPGDACTGIEPEDDGDICKG
jgi:hypothetical protein